MKRETLFLILGTATTFLAAVAISRLFVPSMPNVRVPILVEQPKQFASKRELVGVSSCSASACHGGTETGARLSEASTWRALDPHARAFTTLLSDESQHIAERLWHGKMKADEAPLCLKCHVHPNYENARPNFRKQDGVGCESCHGTAGEWLTPHYRPGWTASLGMLDTKSLHGRASVCATCHVGTPDVNVDHDLIAAGHPALRFEFSTYLANLPPHWDMAKDKRMNSLKPNESLDFEVRAWALGQLASSAAAFELTAHRADPANGKLWPEFAELDCFACHHVLKGQPSPFDRDQVWRRRPGEMPMSDWYHRLLKVADTKEVSGVYSKRANVDHRGLLKDREQLAASARESANALRRNAGQRIDVADTHLQLKLLSIVRSNETSKQLRRQTWDELTQDYLALSALRRTELARKENVTLLDSVLAAIRSEIQFAPGHLSPKRND